MCALRFSCFVPLLHYAEGSYFDLAGRSPFSHLVYPLPSPGGLGVHLTIDMAGRARFGPDVQWVEEPDFHVDPARTAAFYDATRCYWRALPEDRKSVVLGKSVYVRVDLGG